MIEIIWRWGMWSHANRFVKMVLTCWRMSLRGLPKTQVVHEQWNYTKWGVCKLMMVTVDFLYPILKGASLPSTRPHPNPGASWSTMYHVCHVCMHAHQPYMFHVMMATGAPLGGPSHHKHLWSVPRIRTCFYLLKNAKINYINTVFFFFWSVKLFGCLCPVEKGRSYNYSTRIFLLACKLYTTSNNNTTMPLDGFY